jgi:hypothetical protein
LNQSDPKAAFHHNCLALRRWPRRSRASNEHFDQRDRPNKNQPRAFYKLPDAADGDTNAWTDDAEELVRSHAKMLLYMDVLEDDQNAQRMGTKIPVLLDALRSATSARMATGRLKGTEF